VHSKINVSRKVKTTSNLGRREYIPDIIVFIVNLKVSVSYADANLNP